MLKFLDVSLTVFHDLFTLWNCLAWLVPKFRTWHFLTINITLFSWMGLGYFYGWGFCFLTEYHYQIKHSLGERNLPPSYIQLRCQEIFGFTPNLETTNLVVGIIFGGVGVISYWFWFSRKDTP